MALPRSGLLRLLKSLRSADGLELVRSVAERMPQKPIESGVAARIGAEGNKHTEVRVAHPNGHHGRTPTIQACDLDLAVLTLRTGSSSPGLLERRCRIDQALYAVIVDAYVHGVST
ncbi:transposase [Streptomyces sp. P9-A2]